VGRRMGCRRLGGDWRLKVLQKLPKQVSLKLLLLQGKQVLIYPRERSEKGTYVCTERWWRDVGWGMCRAQPALLVALGAFDFACLS